MCPGRTGHHPNPLSEVMHPPHQRQSMKSTGSILTSIGKEAIGRNDLKIMIGMWLSLGLQLVAHFPGPQIRIHVLNRT